MLAKWRFSRGASTLLYTVNKYTVSRGDCRDVRSLIRGQLGRGHLAEIRHQSQAVGLGKEGTSPEPKNLFRPKSKACTWQTYATKVKQWTLEKKAHPMTSPPRKVFRHHQSHAVGTLCIVKSFRSRRSFISSPLWTPGWSTPPKSGSGPWKRRLPHASGPCRGASLTRNSAPLRPKGPMLVLGWCCFL